MHRLVTLRDNLCEELEKLAKKSDINANELDVIDKMAHSIKNLNKILSEGERESSYSSYDRYERSHRRRGRDGDGDGRYSERSYDSYDGGWNTQSNRMSGRLRSMLADASNTTEREALMRCIEQMERQ